MLTCSKRVFFCMSRNDMSHAFWGRPAKNAMEKRKACFFLLLLLLLVYLIGNNAAEGENYIKYAVT